MLRNTIPIKILIFSSIIFLLISCVKDNNSTQNPLANFTSRQYFNERWYYGFVRDSFFQIFVTDTITFINTSENATYYQWSFGDGTYSFAKNPSHLYPKTGNYLMQYAVTLRAIGNNGSNYLSQSIFVIDTNTNASIFPDKGIKGINLGDTWQKIKIQYSGQYQVVTDTFGIIFQHSLYIRNKGIIITFFNFSNEISSTDIVGEISVISPYSGSLNTGNFFIFDPLDPNYPLPHNPLIKLGDSILNAISDYPIRYILSSNGNTEMLPSYDDLYVSSDNDTCYIYSNLGVQFWKSGSSPLVSQMDIFNIYNIQSQREKGKILNIHKMIKIVREAGN